MKNVKNNKTDEEVVEEEIPDEEEGEFSASLIFAAEPEAESSPRSIGIFSDIDEEVASDVIQSLLVINNKDKKKIELEELEFEPEPIKKSGILLLSIYLSRIDNSLLSYG